MDENNEPKEKKSFSQKYISRYVAIDLKTIIPLIIFIGSVSFGAYSAFTHETRVAIVEIAKACDKNENEVIALKEKHIALSGVPGRMEQNEKEVVILKARQDVLNETIMLSLKDLSRKIEKTNDLLLGHILSTKKSGH